MSIHYKGVRRGMGIDGVLYRRNALSGGTRVQPTDKSSFRREKSRLQLEGGG